jgi:predicted mannosyl-3-phosphoglycerate phosphatase (HAD superfamily)
LRQTANVLYIAIDGLIPLHGKGAAGLDEFCAALDHAGIPAVWLTNRSRLQFDDARRKYAHSHPFVTEDGCCVCLPEDYFHLRPDSSTAHPRGSKTVRLGRFTCIPVAEALPAAADALESLSEETSVPVVTLRSLSPRELVQNSGLPLREAELARQRDFDDLFFFAGASEKDIARFLEEAKNRNLQLRQQGTFWSIAIGANTQHCIRDLSKLYDRALRYHAHTVGIATPELAGGLFPLCERSILLTSRKNEGAEEESSAAHGLRFSLNAEDVWDEILTTVGSKM